jgi:hypothetical protein
MMIGLRFLLLFAVMAIAVTFLTYVFTKNPRFLTYTKRIVKVTFAVVALFLLIYFGERLLLVL